MSTDAYRYFRVEAKELLEALGQAALDLEKCVDSAGALARILRLTHTLKGAARVVRQGEIAQQAHAVEALLTPLRAAGSNPSDAELQQFNQALASMGQALAGLAQPERDVEQDAAMTETEALTVADAAVRQAMDPRSALDAPAPAMATVPPGVTAPDAIWRTVRVDMQDMDELLDGLTESHAHVVGLRQHAQAVMRADQLVHQLLESWRAPSSGVDVRGLAVRGVADELQTMLGRLHRGLMQSTEQLERELRQTRDGAERLRLVPVQSLFTALERAVRDVARAQGKAVHFEGQGGEVRLDAEVLSAVQAALVQMVRNAVAHGIEPQARRAANGKPVQGRVTVAVRREGASVVFECQDDGVGIDIAALRKVWLRQKGSGTQAPATDEALLQSLFLGGLSTVERASDIAGHGIGLNVVQQAADALGGAARIHTRAGQGCTLTLRVPLTLASLETLSVEVEGMALLLPLQAVVQTVRLARTDLTQNGQGEAMVYEGRQVPVVPLARLMRPARPAKPEGARCVVLLRGEAGLLGLSVDRVQGIGSAVLRPLPDQAPAADWIAGAALDVGGQPRLVLDAEATVRAARRLEPAPWHEATRHGPVLVVDDSLTSRMLEQSILESAGYTVETAVSAEDALDKIRRQSYGLFLVDVDMPGMDGFTFVATLRADPQWHGTPAILITSRSSEEDRQRGRDAGAQGYIVKGEFDQNAFLSEVRRLILAE